MKLNRFKDFREDKDLRQGEVAKFLNISVSTYRNYEHGVHEAPYSVLIKLSKLYGVSINRLLGERTSSLDLSDEDLELFKKVLDLLNKKIK